MSSIFLEHIFDFCQIWHKHAFGLEGELVRFQRSKVTVTLHIDSIVGLLVSVNGVLETTTWFLTSQTGSCVIKSVKLLADMHPATYVSQ